MRIPEFTAEQSLSTDSNYYRTRTAIIRNRAGAGQVQAQQFLHSPIAPIGTLPVRFLCPAGCGYVPGYGCWCLHISG
jgi:hypothetical protein